MEQQTDNQARPSVIAEAKYVPTEETYQNMVFLMNLRKNRAIQIGGAGLVLLSGLQLYTKSTTRTHIALLCVLAGAGLIFVLLGKYMSGYQGKRAYRNILSQFGKNSHLPCMIQTYYEDRVEVHSEKSENIRKYPYSQLTDIRENADMLVFVFSKNIGVAVPRKAFSHSADGYEVSKHIRKNYNITASTSLYTPRDTSEILSKPKM